MEGVQELTDSSEEYTEFEEFENDNSNEVITSRTMTTIPILIQYVLNVRGSAVKITY